MKCRDFLKLKNSKASVLTYTTDMAAFSFSLPAGDSCPTMRADDESFICYSCYAQLNRYNMPNVLKSQWTRFLFIKKNLKTQNGQNKIVKLLTKYIKKYCTNGYFRGHDSGDFFNPKYVEIWIKVCENLPNIKFWFPTRVYPNGFNLSKNWVDPLQKLNSLPNVVVRPSALKWNEDPPKISFLSKGTTGILKESDKINNVSICPKTINGGSCETNNCRECWENDKEISYLVHGYNGKHKVSSCKTPNILKTRNRIKQECLKLTISATKKVLT